MNLLIVSLTCFGRDLPAFVRSFKYTDARSHVWANLDTCYFYA